MRSVGSGASIASALTLLVLVVGCGATPEPTDSRQVPAAVGELPVLSVAEAVAIADEGALAGRAVAVAGFFFEQTIGCPAPNRFEGALERRCVMAAFTDDPESARLCRSDANSRECSGNVRVASLPPMRTPETMGLDALRWSGDEPLPVVVIGHLDDPRKWVCPRERIALCARTFVADRFVWVNGLGVEAGTPRTFDELTFQGIEAVMSLEQVMAAIGPEHELVTAAPFKRGEISSVDPRFNLVGDEVVWVVRSYVTGADPGGQSPSRAVVVTLVDDSTGQTIDTLPLAMPADFDPVQLWLESRRDDVRGDMVPPDDFYPFFAITGADEGVLREGMVSGWTQGGNGSVTIGPGAPIVLQPGTFEVAQWLATAERGNIGQPVRRCSAAFEVSGDLGVRAVFPPGAACQFDPPLGPPAERV